MKESSENNEIKEKGELNNVTDTLQNAYEEETLTVEQREEKENQHDLDEITFIDKTSESLHEEENILSNVDLQTFDDLSTEISTRSDSLGENSLIPTFETSNSNESIEILDEIKETNTSKFQREKMIPFYLWA